VARRPVFTRLALKVVTRRNRREARTIVQAIHIDDRARFGRRAATDLALAMEEHRAAHRIAGLALVQPGTAVLAQVKQDIQIIR